ncbi:histone-lysine N-methyltransferase, H3 lysine-9 specific SUVH4-like isoform X2 [Tasmannia lanceolata]|uniref:histone-lysine N-methyltransferase, H3 lysine-9 specific SUVH4-like isoform X2 n=1 Tax=Tasmannia lanceolata TaxID=3420 RepID=UPI0040648DD2
MENQSLLHLVSVQNPLASSPSSVIVEDLVSLERKSVTKSGMHATKIISGEVFQERRCSARLQNRPVKEKPSYSCEKKVHDSVKKGSKRAKTNHRNEGSKVHAVSLKFDEAMGNGDVLKSSDEDLVEKQGIGNESVSAEGKSAYARVKDTLRIFNSHYLHFVQEEEQRCKKVDTNDTAKSPKSKGGNMHAEDIKRSSKRPDLKAVTKMIDDHAILYPEKRIGDIPGIDVGHQFFSRAEMCVIGFHGHWLNGIDYMGQAYSKLNNMEHEVPVRVTRGHVSVNSYCGKVYTYDGLYKVIHYWAEKGVSGYTVYKYRLRRLEGQPALTTDQVHFTRAQAPKSSSELRGLVCDDISGGQENMCIPATNLVDDPPVPPIGYVYRKSNVISESVKLPMAASGCNCKGSCVDPKSCACARLNGSDFPYVRKDGGRLVQAKAIVFECGPNCGCGPSCVNRTSQKGLRYRLEVFRTPKKGWAVRSWDSIPSGAPICEYTGVLMRTDELEDNSENNFIFEIDCLQTMKGLDGRERRLGDVSKHANAHLEGTVDKKTESAPEFCIDAGSVGNIARFINHSCQPNLFVQCVLSSHHDIKLARVMLFAADNIPPLQELAYDYGYALDSVMGPDGNVKKMVCYCGAVDCRKRLY